MENSFILKFSLMIIVFIILIALGSNLSIERLAVVIGEEIRPFYSLKIEDQKVLLNLSTGEYQFELLKPNEFRQKINTYIQNSRTNVKLTLIPAFDYLHDRWERAIYLTKERVNDLKEHIQIKR